MINLKVFTPTEVLINQSVTQVDVETIDGAWTLLPRHVDFIGALDASIASYTANGKKHYFACNNGVLIKKGPDVYISTKLAVISANLDTLKKTIEVDFKQMQQQRKSENVSMSRLEIGLTKGLMALQQGETRVGI